MPGTSSKGGRARLAHDGPTAAVAESTVPNRCHKIYWARSRFGGYFALGDGAAVASDKFLFEPSSAIIEGLGPTATGATVVALLASLGLPITEDCVLYPPYPFPDDTQRVAELLFDDPKLASRVCSAVAEAEAEAGWKHKGVTANPRYPIRTAINSSRVLCSWERPKQDATLTFTPKSEPIAKEVWSGFSRGHFMVLDQQVPCEPLRRTHGDWVLKLRGLPAGAKRDDVTRSLGHHLLPYHIRLQKTTPETPLSVAEKEIRSLLLGFGPLKEWTPTRWGFLDAPFKSEACFENEVVARQAVAALNDKEFPFLRGGKLTVRLVHCLAYRIPLRVYRATEEQIAGLCPVLPGQAPDLKVIRRQEAGYASIRVEGPDAKAVIKTGNSLLAILRGKPVRRGDETLRFPSCSFMGQFGWQKLRRIERDHNIVLDSSPDHEDELRVLGCRRQVEKALPALATLSRLNLSGIYHVELNDQDLFRGRAGGFDDIAAAIGPHNVLKLDQDSSPNRLVFRGSDAHVALVRSILDDTRLRPNRQGHCTACSSPDELLLTSCNHIFCAECFQHMCSAGIDGDGIRCRGNEDRCGFVFPFWELASHLCPRTMRQILGATMKAYIARHPQQFRHCPTPNCGQVYPPPNPTADGLGEASLHTCTECLTGLCTSCNAVWHPGSTCDEQKRKRGDGEAVLARAKKELGIKDCPKCGAAIERTAGCNHVHCAVCKTHICWVCMQTFTHAEPTYDHMHNEHGGFFPDQGDH